MPCREETSCRNDERALGWWAKASVWIDYPVKATGGGSRTATRRTSLTSQDGHLVGVLGGRAGWAPAAAVRNRYPKSVMTSITFVRLPDHCRSTDRIHRL